MPTQVAEDTVAERLKENETESHEGLTTSDIMQMLQFSLKTYFMFDDIILTTCETLMCSLIDGVLTELENQKLRRIVLRDHDSKFWVRYMDANFIIINLDRLVSVKYVLARVFMDIQYSMADEKSHELPFLDI